jgi:hypothetical protein
MLDDGRGVNVALVWQMAFGKKLQVDEKGFQAGDVALEISIDSLLFDDSGHGEPAASIVTAGAPRSRRPFDGAGWRKVERVFAQEAVRAYAAMRRIHIPSRPVAGRLFRE